MLPHVITASLIGATSASTFPSFSAFRGAAYSVGYDARALTLDGEHALFLSGAIHPPRGTPEQWDDWFAQSKRNGLNMVQVYVFWNFHQPTEDVTNWSGRANLTDFVLRAAAADLFVNLRIGPYVCAEWTYGGLPAWLGLKPGVKFRQSNPIWQPAMEKWFNYVVAAMAGAKLFATQGGPIVLVQVENELPSTDIPYVAWCGDMAARALKSAGVAVPITMCNGETANNTINTCNGKDCVSYLEKHGQSGRILIDQPALWTENEGGFQAWGGAPPPGTEPYFWGRATAEQALSVMRWIARGGSHMDYYMWVGGSNFGRWAGDGITTMYASDATLCPDGLPHEPKFSHLRAMHEALAAAADDLLGHPAQLDKSETISGGDGAVAYVYGDVAFLEAALLRDAHFTWRGHTYDVPRASSSLVRVSSGEVVFNSRDGSKSSAPTSERTVRPATATADADAYADADARSSTSSLGPWKAWQEPIEAADAERWYPTSARRTAPAPIEMTNLTGGLTTFAFYETATPLLMGGRAVGSTLDIRTYEAMSTSVWVDGKAVGSAEDHTHGLGAPRTFKIPLPSLPSLDPAGLPAAAAAPEATFGGPARTLTVLAEELGYANYGFKDPLKKGLDSPVEVDGVAIRGAWSMRVGLAGEHAQVMTAQGSSKVPWQPVSPGAQAPATWYQTSFALPPELVAAMEASATHERGGQAGTSNGGVRGGGAAATAQLLLNATGLKRGRVWVNGHDAGRYWVLPRNDGSACFGGASQCATQTLYHLPLDWLKRDVHNTRANLLTLFEAEGGSIDFSAVSLAVSTMGPPPTSRIDPTKVSSCEF